MLSFTPESVVLDQTLSPPLLNARHLFKHHVFFIPQNRSRSNPPNANKCLGSSNAQGSGVTEF